MASIPTFQDEENPVLKRLLQQVTADQPEIQRPILDRLMAHINSMPQEEEPRLRDKIFAGLAGFGAGIHDPSSGVKTAQDYLHAPYRRAMEKYKMEGSQLDDAARIEEMGASHRESADNRRQMMLDRIIDDQRASETQKMSGEEHKRNQANEDRKYNLDFSNISTDNANAAARLAFDKEKFGFEKTDKETKTKGKKRITPKLTKEIKEEARTNVMGLSGFSHMFNPDGSFSDKATDIDKLGAKSQMRKEFETLRKKYGYTYENE